MINLNTIRRRFDNYALCEETDYTLTELGLVMNNDYNEIRANDTIGFEIGFMTKDMGMYSNIFNNISKNDFLELLIYISQACDSDNIYENKLYHLEDFFIDDIPTNNIDEVSAVLTKYLEVISYNLMRDSSYIEVPVGWSLDRPYSLVVLTLG